MDKHKLIFDSSSQLKEDALVDLFIIDGTSSLVNPPFTRLNLISPEQSGGGTIEYVNEAGSTTTYNPVPISLGGIEISGSNKLPTPKLAIGNVDGGMTDLSRDYDDLIGFKLFRIRTYTKYFSKIGSTINNTSSSATQAHFTPEVWYFSRKVQETKLGVVYELGSAFDVEGLAIPKRRMYPNYCPFAYRGPECAYAGPAVPTAGKPDGCSKTLEACKLHFGASNPLRYGGFPTVAN